MSHKSLDQRELDRALSAVSASILQVIRLSQPALPNPVSISTTELEAAGLTPKQAAKYSGLTIDWLKRARMYGHVDGRVGPPYRRVTPRHIIYLKADLDAFLGALPVFHHVEEEL